MKPITSYKPISLLIFLLVSISSCKDFLEVEPRDQVSDATLWSSTANADLFLHDVYAGIPTMDIGDPWENYSDNSLNGQAGRVSGILYGASIYTPSNAPNRWALYTQIRKCNLFITKVTASALSDPWKTQRLGEARFLRAYYYMLLWTAHGGVPIITDVLNQSTQGDAIFRARNTPEETVKFITDECAAAAKDLPTTAEAGRATKGAALTLKAWCELFNASPLYNAANDKAKWALAAATYKSVMDLKTYTLFPDYNTLFFEENNNNVEVIFDRQHLGGTGLANYRESYLGPRFVYGTLTGFGHVDPTQDLVDEYAMANGLPITAPGSGYDPQNPYVNREKRFYQSIVYDGSTWLGDLMIMKQGVGSLNATDLNNSSVSTKTGYYLRKGMNTKYASVNNNQNSANLILFRYAEVLLGYAEAQNEAVGPDESVYSAVNLVRARSELPPLSPGMTQAQMRVAIHRERRVELAFEDKRLPDLMRLKLAEKVLNGTVHAMKIDMVGGKPVYTVIPAAGGAKTFYPEKNYVLPIPQSAIDKNPKLTQNPNY
ncbi:putative outer membrane starch-binding protein [Larkinella arboricola]|uniref:Putative outer membrane starch-binding protein n=1 Tax=Larkinella arboricola TaxID=643671 RepID=A0A327WMK0_LARAB|nr:RagB/SusD family nutrient uptake outer membrane protein [Larkinella arboricola]RAJ93233.1 putative outer membrane starch-binding protein [Larkinella arboricola]